MAGIARQISVQSPARISFLRPVALTASSAFATATESRTRVIHAVPGEADLEVVYGRATDTTLVGDWNGDGTSEIAVYRPSTAMVIQRTVSHPNTKRARVATVRHKYGIPRG